MTAPTLPLLTDLFAQDADRLSKLSMEVGDLYFDFSKLHLDDAVVAVGVAKAQAMGFEDRREALASGEIANVTEGRAAEHMAERGTGNEPAIAQATLLRQRMFGLIAAVDAGVFGEIKHIIHVGIGGSALGPKLLMDALGRDEPKYQIHIASNVDGAALAEIFAKVDAQTTLLAVASKTFTTTETLMNAQSVLTWMAEQGVEDPHGRVIALTAAPDKAVEWGVDESRVLPFAESVGGRYSLWCSIGFPAAIGLGAEAFEEMLAGAALMDKHFMTAPLAENAPVLAAIADRMYAEAGVSTRAVFAYDERLRLLPDYLQQLEMESNGKSVTLEGEPLTVPSAAITWGGVGTDAQHAVFQLLHQGTHILPVEFIASATPGHDLDPAHHETLLINCFAQGAALMSGKANDDPARSYAGNRPSSTILVQDVTPATVGALIAFYEHRVFAGAVLMGINPFDQFGVELGKAIAKQIANEGPSGFDASTMALIQRAIG